MPTPLTDEDVVPPELPENTAGIINLLIDAMKLGRFQHRADQHRAELTAEFEHALPFRRSDLHEIDQLCHRLGVASGTPSWYWLEFVMPRPLLTPLCTEPGCYRPQTLGGPHCDDHTF